MNGLSFDVTSGEFLSFADLTTDPVTAFQILGIDGDLMLDPESPLAFVTGIVVENFLGFEATVTQTPITVDYNPGMNVVPLPAGGLLLISGFGALGLISRRRSCRRA